MSTLSLIKEYEWQGIREFPLETVHGMLSADVLHVPSRRSSKDERLLVSQQYVDVLVNDGQKAYIALLTEDSRQRCRNEISRLLGDYEATAVNMCDLLQIWETTDADVRTLILHTCYSIPVVCDMKSNFADDYSQLMQGLRYALEDEAARSLIVEDEVSLNLTKWVETHLSLITPIFCSDKKQDPIHTEVPPSDSVPKRVSRGRVRKVIPFPQPSTPPGKSPRRTKRN